MSEINDHSAIYMSTNNSNTIAIGQNAGSFSNGINFIIDSGTTYGSHNHLTESFINSLFRTTFDDVLTKLDRLIIKLEQDEK